MNVKIGTESSQFLFWEYFFNSRETGDELTKTTVRRGMEFDVTVHRLLPPTEIQEPMIMQLVE
jgi:hypothetical protein